ncbi:T9SS type A sorting domain-containing protein [Hymenobacter canadensis]|uniref:T9SS type A sorting domain-containing protein n=1 Tax=Hymenobacter canadensis TaxID=2999067 RepID=A0ABY7LPQ2_9BACT|nr:T9SS type A sorting domain-containing protein [Hymenobacter canadensis]WBA40868.1 T9SS type A sorting domain-containing protein [Hymenobacter canadensis]
MKKNYGALTALLVALSAAPAAAQYEFTAANLGAYTQNFNSLTGSVFANNSTILGVYAQAEFGTVAFNPTVIAANDGSNIIANYYHFGDTGSTDRSFGGIAATTTANGIGHAGIRFKNSSGVTIKNLEIQYAMEQWYNSGRQDAARVDVSYLTGTTLQSLLSSAGTWTDINALDVDAPSTTTVISSRDGNSPSNRRVRQVTLNNLNLANGQEIMLRWSYVLNNTTNGNGLSIDDVLVTPVTGIYYSKASGDLDVLGNWGTSTDGTGTAPTNFTAPNITYYVQGTGTASRISGAPGFLNKSTWTVGGANSKVVVGRPGVTGAVLQLADDDDISATIDVGAGATFITQQPNPVFTLGRIDNSSTVEYITTEQPISITQPSYGNLKVNGAGPKLLTANTVVNGNLIFVDNAKLQLGNNNLNLIRGGTITGNSATAYVVTNGKGSLRQSVTNNGTDVLFPVGSTASSYTPAFLQQPLSTTARNEDVFSVRVIDGLYRRYTAAEDSVAGTVVKTQNVKKTWLISEEVAGNSNITMGLQWNAADQVGGSTATAFVAAQAYVSHYITGTTPYFDKPAAAASSVSGTRATRTGITSFSPFGVSSRAVGPLPVTLVAFSAARTQDAVHCEWKTASELNNDYFAVERSADGREFVKIGTVAGRGTTAQSTTYSYLDQQPLNGLAYYRLRQTDLDGTYQYSPIVAVTGCATCADALQTLALAPNPGTGVFRVLDANGQPAAVTGTVHNTLGKVVQQLSGQSTLDLQAQPAGIYLLKLSAAHGAKVLRVVKQ